MKDLCGLAGLPLQEVRRRLEVGGARVTVKQTGETGRVRALRRCEREGLVETEGRVVRIRRTGPEVELVVTPTARRPGL